MQCKCSLNENVNKNLRQFFSAGETCNSKGNAIFNLNDLMFTQQNILHFSMFKIIYVKTCTAYTALSYFYLFLQLLNRKTFLVQS